MRYSDRFGNINEMDSSQDKFLKALYTNIVGRALVKLLVNPVVSKIGGRLLSTTASKILIKPFVKSNNIDLSKYEKQEFDSYNDFFIRKIKKNERMINQDRKVLISPCDSKLSVYKIDETSHFSIKNTLYSTNSLLRDAKLAKKYLGGYAMIFRLTVDDYHRYCYVDNGMKTDNRFIQGVLHTVNPVANDILPIYKENSRQYCILKSENFGNVLMMEVGALLVGKIVNYHKSRKVKKGQEKGRFEFGGSTVILLLEKNKVIVDQDLLDNTKNEVETVVKMGEKVGEFYRLVT
ncbi:phosphatidylserine decarboxylase [[Clostridium] fimetarium]|uniref:Phosphatidylserine decarboxylase n=1 Tax=[Clostridium] fimetarium TaxID=99656 RepID=A0A1I0R1G5_9FIRM|nr:phosphatidylserine decarboxylase [[Clostridium] fimetarium]SEW34315.1 phosphatidylserine decarboxylase [[Clostridium] fimetarium]